MKAPAVARSIGTVFAVALGLAGCVLTGCGDSEPEKPTPQLSPASTSGPSSEVATTSPQVTSCSQLLADGWEPSDFQDFDVSRNPTSGIAEFTIGDDRLFLDIHNDEACRRLPTLGPIIAGFSGPVLVPALVDTRARIARDEVEALGLTAKVFSGLGSACLPRRTVIAQRPAPGTRVAARSRVVLLVNGRGVGECGLDLPPASKDLRRIADLFVDFARSTDPDHYGPPADTPIDLFIGGVLRKDIPSTRIPDRRQWQACPGGIGYAGRSCPISALTPFMEYPGPIAATSRAPAHVCAHPTALPASLDVYRTVTLTPDEDRDCTSYFAVQLFVNDVGQIVAVNLVLSEP